jgi:hypothetical protein
LPAGEGRDFLCTVAPEFEREATLVVAGGLSWLGFDGNHGPVRIERPWLWFRGHQLTSLAQIEDVYVDQGDDRTAKVLGGKGLPVTLRFTTAEHARDFVEALYRRGAEAPASFRVMSPRQLIAHFLATTAAIAAANGVLSHGALPLLVLFPLLGLLASLARRERIEIGREGVLYRWAFSASFIPYGAMEAVTLEATTGLVTETLDHVGVIARGGRALHFRPSAKSKEDRRQLATTIARRIREACAAFAEGKPDEGAAALLAPGGRDPGQWVAQMRGLSGAPGYRETAMDEERLLRVVEDATAQSMTRVGAAVALSAMGDMARARVRVASDACVDPALKKALARVAVGKDDAELEAAVSPIVRRATT